MLLLHAIGPADARSAALPAMGLRAEWPLRAVCASGLVVWASQCAQRPRLGRDDLLGHHRLAEQALRAGLCLPVRFPTWMGDEHAVQELLERKHGELVATLARMQGHVELAVTVTWISAKPRTAEAPSVATTPGRRFLEERRQRYAAADQQRAEAQRLAALVEADERVLEARHTLCPSPDIGLSSALLVGADNASAAAKRLRGLQEGVRILVSGPWPPYSFVSREE